MPVGVVVRRLPGVTRWAKWSWRAVSVLPGAAPAQWKLLREQEDGAAEFHAATVPLVLHRADAEAYQHGLEAREPSVYVIMRKDEALPEDRPLDVLLVTASPYEAQDYTDSGEEIVERIPMPPGLVAWVREFTEQHYQPETFIKRQRQGVSERNSGNGIGDPRIPQLTDVYRAPGRRTDRQ